MRSPTASTPRATGGRGVRYSRRPRLTLCSHDCQRASRKLSVHAGALCALCPLLYCPCATRPRVEIKTCSIVRVVALAGPCRKFSASALALAHISACLHLLTISCDRFRLIVPTTFLSARASPTLKNRGCGSSDFRTSHRVYASLDMPPTRR